ncbi:hypothetical protein F7R12_06385 [Pseudomonas tolaasii]|nr:hypothetical protein F7R12_06385 [Pseudomonas tolaasii]
MGAGLPAMQTPRCISYTGVMLSQASQLPHWLVPFQLSAFTRRWRLCSRRHPAVFPGQPGCLA